jgi:DUF1680 family protein
MAKSRRDFLHVSATAATALALKPLSSAAGAAQAQFPAVKSFEARMLKAKPVPLANVRLTGGPLKHAQDITAAYLLSLEPDRMMAFYRVRAGLPQKAQPYTGWDGAGRNLTGHIAGHHLSAVSLMYAATGDTQFKERADYLVREMKEVQDKHGDGYLGALENGREAFAAVSKGDIRSGGFDLNGLWSPWYVLHKTFAGLRDAYRHAGSKTALDLELKYAAWAEGVLKPLTDAQVQKMLNTEHGGMNEVLADLYADTGDKRWLDLSYRFEHRAFTDQLKRHQDNLSGKHGNCQIPKLIGSASRYAYTGDTDDIIAASFFWDRVVQHHSYATGGHGLSEYFGAPDQLAPRVDGRTAETCNVYNMLKLTRRLFSLRPDAHYADFHERALFNHILGSIDPEDARTSYMVPVGRGVQQEYQNMQRDFTCCVGSGMESHALHGDGLFYESADTVYVAVFAPATAKLANGATLKMETGFPDGDAASLAISSATPKTFTLAIRRPYWAGDGFAIRVNGTPIEQPSLSTLRGGAAAGRNNAPGNEGQAAQESVFVEITRAWTTGDIVEWTMPKSLRLEPTPDNKTVAAVMWGPLVLAGNLGPRREPRRGQDTPDTQLVAPVLVGADKPLTDWIVADAAAGNFTAKQVARNPAQPATTGDVVLAPFYRTHRRTYSIYFDVLTPVEFEAKAAGIAAERERVRKLEAATAGFVQPGEMQPERDYNYQSDVAERPVGRTAGRANRAGTGAFSFDMPVDPSSAMAIVVTYFNDLGVGPTTGSFQILVDGTRVGAFAPNTTTNGFFDAEYAIPAELTRGKSKVTVKFQAGTPGRIAPVFGVRTIRK